MNDTILPAEQCQTMPQVRQGVDGVDTQLVTLLAKRFAYMRAAARIKSSRDQVRDEARKTEVIDNAVAQAKDLGIPSALIAALWDQLVEGSIAYEDHEWQSQRG